MFYDHQLDIHVCPDPVDRLRSAWMKMVQLEIRTILAMILREYDFTILPNQNFETYHDMTGRFKKGLKATVEKSQR